MESELPEWVTVFPLATHPDSRGSLTEIFRGAWTDVRPVQWNFVQSRPGTVRGVHVHKRHWDWWVLLTGRATLGLADLREGAGPAQGTTVELVGASLKAVVIPPGVAHGFMFHEPSTHAYAVDRYWDVEDEDGCRWNDPDLGIPWPSLSYPVLLSAKDEVAEPLGRLLRRFRTR